MFRAFGRDGLAERFMEAHSVGDDEGDSHFGVGRMSSAFGYVKLFDVLRMPRDSDLSDPGCLLPAETGLSTVQFAALVEGYDGEFDALGATPTSWEPV